MHKKTIIILTLFLVANIGFSQSDNIKIKSENLKETNYLKIDDFYLTHYLYIDLFLRESLYTEVSENDVSKVIKAIKKYVSPETPLEIEIEKSDKPNYLIKIAIFKKDDATELFIAYTNWNVNKKKFEEEIKIENDSYTRWYFLNDNKMTYRKDMSDKNDYPNMTKTDLANAYLFDELTENDSKIKITIDDALKEKNLDAKNNIMANLMLLKYQIFQRNNDGIFKQVEVLNELFETNKSESNLRGVKAAFNATKFQIKLM